MNKLVIPPGRIWLPKQEGLDNNDLKQAGVQRF